MEEDPRAKWDRIYSEDKEAAPRPAAVLSENAHLLPAKGRALELACGLGGNALFLAGRGLETEAWDISSVATERLAAVAAAQGLPLRASARDVVAAPPPPASYDVIVVSHFLDRALCPCLAAALRPGGLLFYQTFTREAPRGTGPSNPDFRLAPGELLALFGTLRLVVYREEGLLGDVTRGFRDEAMLVACRAVVSEA
ncbi:MAG TPA: methyltransferase domain-containing protein [Gammaproteobacteria bacterium]|nr:methyltransferase domain-containing protein [Gammaproteobacteria bacterium]